MQLRAFTNIPEFSPKAMVRVSKAAASMCRWVLAMDSYERTQTEIGPKRQALELAQAELDKREGKLQVEELHGHI